MLINEKVSEYLDKAGVHEVNPVWNNSSQQLVVGYLLRCNLKAIKEVRTHLSSMFKTLKISYSLSDFDENNASNPNFILYLNNEKANG